MSAIIKHIGLGDCAVFTFMQWIVWFSADVLIVCLALMAKKNRSGHCPAYFDELVGPTRARYKEKIALCDGVDPYELRVGAQAAVDASLLPTVTHVDIINYLVLSTNYVSLDQMKAYKSLDSHNYFTSGWVRNITAKKLPSERVVVLSQVSSVHSAFHSRDKNTAITTK